MKVIPAINEQAFEKVKEKIFLARDFGAGRIHIDISDGKFTPHQTWNGFGNQEEMVDVKFIIHNFDLSLGVHLMVEDPDAVVDGWLESGMTALVVHFETAKNLEVIMEKCAKSGADFILAVNPGTGIDQLGDLTKFKHIQLLAVDPGAAGQSFQEIILEKIKQLRTKGFAGKIIVDGGINPETAKKVKDSGADVVVSASYVWNNPDPKRGFEELMAI